MKQSSIELHSLEDIPVSADELADVITGQVKMLTGVVLKLPSVDLLLEEVLKNPSHYMTPPTLAFDGIRFQNVDQVWRVTEHVGIFHDKRDFTSQRDAYLYLLRIFRRYLYLRFQSFANLVPCGLTEGRFSREWRYSKELVLKLFSASFQSEKLVSYVPFRSLPKTEDVVRLLLDKEIQLIDDSIHDGLHIQKVGESYALRFYERGVVHGETKYSNFHEVLTKYVGSWTHSQYPADQSRFCGMNGLEFNWNGADP